MLGYLAKYSARYGVKLYAYAIEGSHTQFPALFPNMNRGDFMRDHNSSVARAIPRYNPHYPGGRPTERRYSNEFMPAREDLEEYFFYTVLQCVKDGLVQKISEYPFYNCFHDAVYGIERKYVVVNHTAYTAAKRRNPNVSIRNFEEEYSLRYERLPGYEHLSQKDYAKLMHQKLEERRQKIVQERLAKGLGFLGREALLEIIPGTPARNPKTSTSTTHRPRILCIDQVRREEFKGWYFDIYFRYKAASKHFRAGELSTVFPEGTYRPSLRYFPPRHPPPT